MLSNASKNAIRSIIYLAIYSNEGNKIRIKIIAKALDIKEPFLAKLLQHLSKSGLVRSTKGPAGGFFLDENTLNNKVWRIITCIDGEDRFEQCFLGLSKCEAAHPCPVHHIVFPFRESLLKDFKSKTINEYAQDIVKIGRNITLNKLLPTGDLFSK